MALISATYTFTTVPVTPGGSVTVTGASESEVKTKVLATLQTRRDAQQGGTDSLDTDLAAMNS